jgi:Zn-dependent oligopeptidase
MTEEERRTAQLLKAEFESSGIHLPADEREEVRALLNEITALETEFGNNVIMKRTGFQVSEADLARQLPPDVIRSVVLPHPEGPNSAKNSFCLISRLTLSRATTSP